MRLLGRRSWGPISGAVELPGNPVWVFESDVALPESLIQLDARALNARRAKGLRHPFEFAFVGTSQGDVVKADSRRIEAVTRWGICRRTSDAKCRPTCRKEEQVGTIQKHREAEDF